MGSVADGASFGGPDQPSRAGAGGGFPYSAETNRLYERALDLEYILTSLV